MDQHYLSVDDMKKTLDFLEHYAALCGIHNAYTSENHIKELHALNSTLARKIMLNSRLIITITGPSCSGKSTLAKKMVESGNYVELISTTTREKRYGEVDGVNYYFTTHGEFDRKVLAERVEFGGNKYGLEYAEIQRGLSSGKIPFVIVEPNGLDQICRFAEKEDFSVFSIFVSALPQTRWKRYLARASENGSIQSYLTNDLARIKLMFNEEEDWQYHTPGGYGFSVGYDLKLNMDDLIMTPDQALEKVNEKVLPIRLGLENNHDKQAC